MGCCLGDSPAELHTFQSLLTACRDVRHLHGSTSLKALRLAAWLHRPCLGLLGRLRMQTPRDLGGLVAQRARAGHRRPRRTDHPLGRRAGHGGALQNPLLVSCAPRGSLYALAPGSIESRVGVKATAETSLSPAR